MQIFRKYIFDNQSFRVEKTYSFIKLLFAVLTTLNIQAASCYVAKAGNDSNPGTEAQPWLTIQKSADTIVAGDIVYNCYDGITIATEKNSGLLKNVKVYNNILYNYKSQLIYINKVDKIPGSYQIYAAPVN